MTSLTVSIVREPEAQDLPLPSYATPQSAGLDLYACIDVPLVLQPGMRAAVSSGIRIALPQGYEAQVRPRSGLALRHGIGLLNSPGTIDSDYRGVIRIILINLGSEPVEITRGERIAQMVIAPVVGVEWKVEECLPDTDRGGGGFGHTGRS